MLLLRLVGFSCMAIMGIFTSIWSNSPLIIFIFLLRTGVNNAGYPIQKAVLMDYVPKVGFSTEAVLIMLYC
jgi:Fe2+ transport system protein B